MKELIKTVLAITIIFTVAKSLSDSFLSGWISSVVCYVFLDITYSNSRKPCSLDPLGQGWIEKK